MQKENSDLAKFAEYLESHLQRQKQMGAVAEQIGVRLTKVPLYFESQPWTLVEKVAGNLR